MGGGTSMSYKLFALFRKGLAAARGAQRSGSHERALCEAVALTKTMQDNDAWWSDTDAPEEVTNIVKALGSMWSTVLSSPLRPRKFDMLRSWLGAVKDDWEGAAAEHLDETIHFDFEAKKPLRTPQKERSDLEVRHGLVEKVRGTKRKQGPVASAETPTKVARSASASTETWLHRMDSELPRRQASAVQLRCEGGGKKRAIVVSGAYPLRAVGFALAEAFGRAVDEFNPHPNKGECPSGLDFVIERLGERQRLKATLKIVQAVQEPGDSITIDMEGLALTVTLDAIMFKKDDGWQVVSHRPMPRCVGGDQGLTPQLLKRLNRIFFHDRKPIEFLGCSKQQKITATIDDMARPIVFLGVELVGEVRRWDLQPMLL